MQCLAGTKLLSLLHLPHCALLALVAMKRLADFRVTPESPACAASLRAASLIASYLSIMKLLLLFIVSAWRRPCQLFLTHVGTVVIMLFLTFAEQVFWWVDRAAGTIAKLQEVDPDHEGKQNILAPATTTVV